MKKFKKIISLFCLISIFILLSVNAFATDYLYSSNKNDELDIKDIELYVGGMPFGVKIQTKGLQVVKFDGNNSPSKLAGVKAGDTIIKVGGKEISTIEDLTKRVNESYGKEILVTVLRNDKEINLKIKPEYNRDEGKYKIGVWLKDSTSGIGTITYINPENNEFGGLGHGICDSNTGNTIPLSRGIVLDVTINGVLKGQIGKAGELKGVFNAKKIGVISENSPCGVFGYLSNCPASPENKMKLCPKEELVEGDAYIWCTIGDCAPQKYNVKISEIDTNGGNIKNFKVKITDKRLLELTGGIVQGMSGSPIIQNGRLVGAVTHVLVNNPTEGYGIFIENMLNASNEC